MMDAESIIADRRVLQSKLWDLLARQAHRLTKGKSSSIPRETGLELLRSICYVLGIGIDPSPAVLKRFRSMNLEREFETGLQVLKQKLEYGKELQKRAYATLPKCKSESMDSTLAQIGTFGERYDPNFFAHRIPCDIDYQLCHPISDSLPGIDYINAYLDRILIENEFLQRFDFRRCSRLLEVFCPDYRKYILNLYDPIATNAIGRTLLDLDARPLQCTSAHRKAIANLLGPRSQNERRQLLEEAATTLQGRLSLQHPQAGAYLRRQAEAWLPRLMVVLEEGDLSHVFLPFEREKTTLID